MDSKQRSDATQTVWGILIFALIVLGWTGAAGDQLLPMLVVCLIAAVAATGFIWDWGGALQRNSDGYPQRKRRNSGLLAEVEEALDELDLALDDMLDAEPEHGERQKRKRDRIDAALRQMSDEELLQLRQRLSAGDIDEEMLYNRLVGDDGEFLDAKQVR
jgi:hypothetical protein